MNLGELLLLSIALAVDAFAVGAAIGVAHRRPRQIFRLSFHFGLFQALLCLAGLLAGLALFSHFHAFDHWIASGLLFWIGLRMLRKGGDLREGGQGIDLTRGLSLVFLSLAVSIDALAAGVGLAAVETFRLLAVVLIGLVASLATWAAFLAATPLERRLGAHGERIAGIVLIALGFKILMSGLLLG